MSDAAICLLILAVTVGLFVWNRLPVEVVALGSALACYATGLIDASQVFAGFGDPVIAFIAALFVIAEALGATGVTAWAGQQVLARAGTSPGRLVVWVMVAAAGLTALISVNGSTAALLPMVVLLAVRLGRSPSQLAMPLAFAGHAASLLVLTATPINLLVSEAAEQAGVGGFGFFEFAAAGVPLLAGTIAIAAIAGPRLLPQRTPKSLPPDLSAHSRALVHHYQLGNHTQALRIPAGSPATGKTTAWLRTETVDVLGAVAADHTTARGTTPLTASDILLVRGTGPGMAVFTARWGLQPLPADVTAPLTRLLVNHDLGIAEIVLGPRTRLAGNTVYPGMSTGSGELVVVAVDRAGQPLDPGPVILAPGDTLLVRGSWPALDRHTQDDDLLIVDPPAAVRRQAVPLGPGSTTAIAITAAMILLMASGLVATPIAALIAAGAMVISRVVTMGQAYRGISWTVLVIVAGMFPLSAAMRDSGAAAMLADIVVGVFGTSPYLLLTGLFLLTTILGQVISNTATALIVIPIAVSAANDAGISVRSVLMSIAVAAAAALLTPIATPANLMIQQPGGYRFGDYLRLGLPTLAWFGVVAIGIVPLAWPL